jgi:phosphotransferase system enzyme I (PtsP)
MVKKDISKMKESLSEKLYSEELGLFDVFNLMLESESFTGVMRNRIEAGNWAPGALRETVIEHERIFNEMDDDYLRERIDDIRDLGYRLLRYLQMEEQVHRSYAKNTILVGEDITAAMLAEIPVDCLVGVISARGSRTSHIAILARAMGIPTIMGATDLPVGLIDGCQVILDGYAGRIYVNPNTLVVTEYQRLIDEEADLREELAGINEFPAETVDGTHIPLYVNTGLLADLSPIRGSGAEGIGLYRTEYPFMMRQSFPGEIEQARVYREVLEECAPFPVVLRTLDVGGDKALPYFPIVEENPFLGWRGIRITLDHPEIFLVQIRAMMRASIGLNNLNILLPMISDVVELNDALALIHQAYEELMEEELDVVMPRVGVMIEVPSAVYQAGALARRVDFLSIGTNDLTQYLLAVDRNNPRVANLYDSLHPAVIRAMLQVVESARVHGKPVSVCGEMAGDPVAAVILVGMGIHSLSMSVASLSRVKWVIRNIAFEQAEEILSEVLTMDNVRQIRQLLTNKLEFAGMGGLVRAGK